MKVSEQIIEVLNELCIKFGLAIDWTNDNVIPYVEDLFKRYINYEIVTSISWMIFSMIIFLISIFILVYMKKNRKNIEPEYLIDYTNFLGASIIFVAFSIILMLIIFMIQIYDIIACFTIPEKIIFEEIRYLINIH